MTAIPLACATCAANYQGEGANAIGSSILFLLGVILAVIGSVVFLMVRLARRANRFSDHATLGASEASSSNL